MLRRGIRSARAPGAPGAAPEELVALFAALAAFEEDSEDPRAQAGGAVPLRVELKSAGCPPAGPWAPRRGSCPGRTDHEGEAGAGAW